jgi:hypothetical protein
MALIKTDYEEGRLQPTPAGHPQLATARLNYFLLVYIVNKQKKKTPPKSRKTRFYKTCFFRVRLI